MTDDQWVGPIGDEIFGNPVLSSQERFGGHVWSIRTDTVDIGGDVVDRDILIHPGAVGIIALNNADCVYLLRQYRHPVGMALCEAPAGLLDVAGEDPLHTAKRELAEEAGLEAHQWNVLVDYLSSPGGTTEALRSYLARDIAELPGGRHLTGEAEEKDMPGAWVPLDEAYELVMTGRISNVLAVVGILATYAARSRNWVGLRPPDSPWKTREHLVATGRVHERR